VVAYPELPEAQLPQRIFSTLDCRKRFPRHRTSVLDAVRKAGRSRFVPDAQAGLASQFSYLSLGQTRIQKRSGDLMLRGCSLSGAEVSLVIHVYAIGNGVKGVLSRELFHNREQLIFTVEAAAAIVANVVSPVELVRPQNFAGDLLLAGEGQSIVELKPGQAGGIRDYGQHVVAKRPVRCPSKKCRVSSARVGDQCAPERLKLPIQSTPFFIKINHGSYPDILC